MRSVRLCAMCCLAVILAAGCAVNNTDILHFLREHKNKVSAIEYRVGIPDRLYISAPQVQEVDGVIEMIRPDGKIHLDLLGEVKVVGMTAKEIAGKLEVQLGRYYVDPQVSVSLAGYNSKKYYVFTQYRGGGSLPYTGRDTLLDAVAKAGLSPGAWTSRVQVIRPAHGETPVRHLVIDVDHMIQTGDWSENILLEPDDIVFIPLTPAAWFNYHVRQLLSPIAPAAELYHAPLNVRDDSEEYHYDREYRDNLDPQDRSRRGGARRSR